MWIGSLLQVLLWVMGFITDLDFVLSNYGKDTDDSEYNKNEDKKVESGETSIKPWRWPHINIYYTKKRDSLDWLLEPPKREMCVSHFPGSVAYILNIFVCVPVAIALFFTQHGVGCPMSFLFTLWVGLSQCGVRVPCNDSYFLQVTPHLPHVHANRWTEGHSFSGVASTTL